jgi:prepilin-type N-terminal cleavage/methylation domain-containing protein
MKRIRSGQTHSGRRAWSGATRRDGGFTLIEMLIAMMIMVVVTGAIFSVMNPSLGTFQAQPEAADMQQRLRVGVDVLNKDLMMAGAGTYSGAAVGTLINYFAPILPYRTGAQNPDPPGIFRTDAITLLYVPATAAQTTIRDPMPNVSAEIKVNEQPGCPSGDELCGFETGMTVLIFDESGSWETFTITHVQTSALHLQHRDQRFQKAYGTGSYIAQIQTHTYYLRADTATETYQLRHYDGYQSDLPVVDDVVDLQFEYFGDSLPPMLRRPVTDPTGPWTSYGPKPPALGMSYSTEWGSGGNCVFTVQGGQHEPRLATLGTAPGNLVPLPAGMLTDGPWCPDSSTPLRYDADLLRIRKVRVTLRVQATSKMLRGPAGVLFTRGGTSNSAQRFLPDQELRFEVSPRNVNLGR